MGTTTDKQDEFLDVDFGETAQTSGDWETVPTGWYVVEIKDLGLAQKSEAKLRSDLALKQREHPETTLESIDKYQWVWTFTIVAGEYLGFDLTTRTTRTFHERSNAGKLAAAALGLQKYDPALARQQAQAAGVNGSKLLMGKRVYASVTEDPDSQNRMWNNIKEYKVVPAARPARPQKEQDKRQREAVPRRNLGGDYPTDDESDIDF